MENSLGLFVTMMNKTTRTGTEEKKSVGQLKEYGSVNIR